MRFTGKSPSGVDKQIEVFNFTIGKAELMILADILGEIHRKTPKSLFTQPFTSRVNAMKTEISRMFKSEGIPYPVRRSELELGDKEVF